MAAKICLVMIVKNEENVIVRSLRSAFPSVHTYCIVDTGSTDATISKIKETAKEFNIDGEIHERPWVNFGHNRSEALKLAHDMAPRPTWCLMLDADDILAIPPRDEHNALLQSESTQSTQALYMNILRGNLHFKRITIFNTRSNWFYVGAVHEYPECPDMDDTKIPTLPDTYMIDARCEGARSQDPLKYEKDAQALEEEYKKNPYNTRAIFYAAQSYRDAGNDDKAREWYKLCAESTGWVQERYVAYLNLIRLTDRIDEKYRLAWKAADICPSRIEASYEVLKATRELNMWSIQAYALGTVAMEYWDQEDLQDMLFVETDIYEYKFYDEFSIHAYYLGFDKVSADTAFAALQAAPPAEEVRIRVNYEFALKRLN
jgi:glycosyltransferase involved in cell wall biosynthesis